MPKKSSAPKKTNSAGKLKKIQKQFSKKITRFFDKKFQKRIQNMKN